MRHLVVALPAPPRGEGSGIAPPSSGSAGLELDYALGTADALSPAVAQSGRAAASLLPQPQGAGAEVIALLPAAAVSWHAVQLPKGVSANASASPRLRAVLDGLLEDRLLDEPERLHLVISPQPTANGRHWVAACDREWLRGWCAVLEAAQRPVDRIVPEAAPLPAGAALLQISGDADHPQACLADTEGVWCAPLAALSQATALPDALDVCCEPQVAAQAEQQLQRNVRVLSAAQRRLQAADSGWNLAQAEFDASGGRRAMRNAGKRAAQALWAPQWRAARWGAAALVLAHLVGLNAWALHEQRALAAKRAAIEGTLTATFPQVKVVIDAPLQMEREIAALRRASGATSSADLEALLAVLAQALLADRVPGRIEFASGELRASGLALQPAEAASLRERVQSRGGSAEVQGDMLVLRSRGTP